MCITIPAELSHDQNLWSHGIFGGKMKESRVYWLVPPAITSHWPWARDICWYFCVKSLHEEKFVTKFCENWTFWCDNIMAMIDKSNILDFSGRPRRIVQSPGKNYDGEGERNLTLRGIFEVLGTYRDYEGGINCSRCGEITLKRCFCNW